MKKRLLPLTAALVLLTACGQPASPTQSAASASAPEAPTSQVASSSQMAAPVELDTEGLIPIDASQLVDGVYQIEVESSSSMFKILGCALTVSGDSMTAALSMNSSAYSYLFPDSAQRAAAAGVSECIPLSENSDGTHTFTLPVTALDAPFQCAAYSAKKEQWYDRTLIFRSDSLPMDAFMEGALVTAESLELEDGAYTVEVALSGGSGKASVQSPAHLTVESGQCMAEIVWSSSNYDYMKVDGVQYDPLSGKEVSVFLIPLACFDRPLTVLADTTAMSQPHEIEYSLYFDSSTIKQVEVQP